MICFPNAKINLGLNIVSKRPNGYHNIETIFYPVPIKDALEVVESKKLTFIQTGIPIDAPLEKNLVMKAYNLLNVQYPLPPLDIHLLKAIPFGAGLGGGSADAAFMLKLLNDFCNLNISSTCLEKMSSLLGADCAFFIHNTPLFASGTGNIFEPISLSLKDYYLCLIKPEIIISTSEAYSMIKPSQPKLSLKKLISQPIEEWKDLMVNDFEKNVFIRHPVIEAIKNTLYEEGAIYASMSGSGSSVFGIFKTPVCIKDKFSSCFVWEGKLE